VPEVVKYLTPRARLIGGVTVKAARDKRTWQGQAETELQTKLNGVMQEYWKLAASNIASGKPALPADFQSQMQAILQRELSKLAAEDAQGQADEIGIEFDPAAVDISAEAWASEYSYNLIKGIDTTTRDIVSNAVTSFTNTPGMTTGDLRDMLSGAFGEMRAQMIAVTEVTRAFSAGEQIYQNMLGEMGVETVREWLTSEDEKVCPICGALDGQRVDIGEMFTDDEGNQYDNPPAHVNCILPGNEVAPPDLVAISRAFYNGPAIEFTFDSGRILSVTQNHPILTRSGWVSARFLNEGSYTIVARSVERIATAINPNYNYTPSPIENVFSTLLEYSGVTSTSVKVSPENFYNDAGAFDGNINVINIDSLLLNDGISKIGQVISNNALDKGDVSPRSFSGNSMSDLLIDGTNASTRCLVCGENLSASGFSAHAFPFDGFALGLVADGHAVLEQALFDNISIHTPLSREFLYRFSDDITTDKIVNIRKYNFSGHVYDLQTKMYELYTCNGVIVKNCRCAVQVRLK
jgi:hypothetical protein